MNAYGLVLQRLTGTVPALVNKLEEVPFEGTPAFLERGVNINRMINYCRCCQCLGEHAFGAEEVKHGRKTNGKKIERKGRQHFSDGLALLAQCRV